MSAAAELRPAMTSAEVLSYRRHHAKPWVFAALVAVGMLSAAAHQFVGERPRRDTRPVAIAMADVAAGQIRLTEAEVHALRIEPVLEREFRTERLIEGRIAYDEEGVTPVFSPYGGARGLRMVAHTGDTVRQGDTLFEVESVDLLRAEGELLSRADAVEKAQAALGFTRWNVARQHALLRAHAASRRDLEQAETDGTTAAAELRTAEAALATARARLGVLGRNPQQIAEVQATRHPNAAVAVTAPIDGTVVQRHLGPGQWLGADTAEPAYTIANLSTVWLIGMAREADLPFLRLGQSLEVVVDALPGRHFEARITRLGDAFDSRTRRLEVCAELQSADGALKPGMQASLRITLAEAKPAIRVPASALLGAAGRQPFGWF